MAVLSTHDVCAVASLQEALLRAARREDTVLSTFVPYAAGEVLALVYGKCRVLDTEAVDDGLRLRVQGPDPVISRIRAALGEKAR